MKIQFYRTVYCNKEKYIIRKEFEWNRPLPRIGEYVTGDAFLCAIEDEYLVKKVTHDLSESMCFIGLADLKILEDHCWRDNFEKRTQLAGWECEKL